MACDTTKRIDFSLKRRYNVAEVMIMAYDTTKKRRGRPPLSDEERELRRIETNKKQAERLKRNGYAAQKKYRETHSGYKKNYEPKIKIPLEFRSNLDELLSKTGMTITELFVGAVEEKYAITLRYPIDKPAKK